MSEIEVKKNYRIYKIILEDGSEYAGSTCDLEMRIYHHKNTCYNENREGYNTSLYKHIRENKLNFDEDNFIVLKEVQNVTEKEARMIEEQYRKEAVILGGNIVLNAQRAYVTEEEKKEYKKNWRIENRNNILEQQKEWYIKNRDKISEKMKEKNKETYECCGSTLLKCNKAQHKKSLKHINYINNEL